MKYSKTKLDEKLWQEATKSFVPLQFAKKTPNPEPNKLLISKTSHVNKKKRNSFNIEATLDLHNYTLLNAEKALINFVLESKAQKMKIILVITGKGERKHSNREDFDSYFSFANRRITIKESISSWLSNKPLSQLVKSYKEALPKDGGSGAYYIFLA